MVDLYPNTDLGTRKSNEQLKLLQRNYTPQGDVLVVECTCRMPIYFFEYVDIIGCRHCNTTFTNTFGGNNVRSKKR